MFGLKNGKYNKISSSILVIFVAVISLVSCKKDDTHPITWSFWKDAGKTKIFRFAPNGQFFDLYDYANTQNDTYEVGEKYFTIYKKTTPYKVTVKGDIISLKNNKLILKYSNGAVDSLYKADQKDCFVGSWIPTQQETNLDSFEINSIARDCIKRDTSHKKQYFRYNFINDSTVVFDYFQKNIKDTFKFFVSQDRLLLMLKKKNYIVSLRRN